MNHVARDLDIDRPLVTLTRRVEDPIDLVKRRARVAQFGAGDGQLFEHLQLGAEVPDLVMQQRVVDSFAQAGRARDHDDGRLLGIRPGDAVAGAQPANAIRDANRAESIDPSVGIGREAGAIFTRATDDVDGALFEQMIEAEDIIARDTEDIGDAIILKSAD
jgi:hypothetical protein